MQYKEIVDEHHKEQLSFKVKNIVWLWQHNIETILLKKNDYKKLGPFTIEKQINVMASNSNFQIP
jgi:hypothetical protein